MKETTGQRLYRIRLACGDGVRNAETLDDFAKRVKRATKRAYSAMTLSLLERMKQKWKLEDVEVFASVDPLKRSREWLAWGVDDEGGIRPTIPAVAEAEVEAEIPTTRPRAGKTRVSGAHRKQA